MNVAAAKRYRLILSAVHMVYRLVNSTFSVKELSLRLTRLLCQFVKSSSASIYILDENKKRFVFVASFDNKINIWQDKGRDLGKIPPQALDVARGKTVFEGHAIGLPLVADDYLGAIFVRRLGGQPPFNQFDREMLGVFAEQAVTAVKNLQFQQQHEKVILGSIRSIGNFMQKQGRLGLIHTPAYTLIVRQLAFQLRVSHEGVKSLEYAALLHDIGIIDVPYAIMSKQGALSAQEIRMIRSHTVHSVALIKPVEFLKPVLPIILHHHEQYDGSGYPSGLKKEQIPLGARIIAVVDAFEAMVQGRPYRGALSVDNALEQLKRNRGTQFDPRVVDAFCALTGQKKFRKLLYLMKH